MKNVLIPTKLNKVAADMLREAGYNVVQDSDNDLLTAVKNNPEAEALIVRSEKITAEIIDLLPKLRLVIRAGAGYNTIDTKYARRKNVDVMNTPGANANGVAEEVFAMALAAYRFVVPADNDTRAGGWEKKKFLGREITGKTLGIVGLGNIGQLVAKHSIGFDMKLMAYDPIVSPAKAEELGVKLVDIETIFKECDIITLHIPENDETRGMINASLLKLTKPGCLLINCARAGIINEDDLRAIKAEKKLLYCNDVYAADAPGPKSIADVADVMLPHLGANTQEANFTAAKRSAEQLIAYAEKGITNFVVNKDLPDGLNPSYQKLAYKLAFFASSILGHKKPVSQIRCSYYGDLNRFDKWFTAPICAALTENFDASQSPEEALALFSTQGINFEIRPIDPAKKYGNSMTIDMETVEGHVSLRGTIAENNLVISRINDYNRVYFILEGNLLVVEYEDRPGVLAVITKACADANINIEDIHAPQNAEQKRAIALLRTDKPVPAAIVSQLAAAINAKFAASITL